MNRSLISKDLHHDTIREIVAPDTRCGAPDTPQADKTRCSLKACGSSSRSSRSSFALFVVKSFCSH
jgi:hypothetical protein